MKGNCQFVKLATGLYEILINDEIQWGPGKSGERRPLKISLQNEAIFTVAYCRFEHRRPVAHVYNHIPANRLRFVVQALTGPKNNCQILYIERKS